MDEKLAARWTAADSLKELLVLPRRISATVIAADRPGTALVVDVGSGPGDYLSTMLDTFPAATGVWTDVSPAMADIARPALAGTGTGSSSGWSTSRTCPRCRSRPT
jgi:trans-aconitate methyltransferase